MNRLSAAADALHALEPHPVGLDPLDDRLQAVRFLLRQLEQHPGEIGAETLDPGEPDIRGPDRTPQFQVPGFLTGTVQLPRLAVSRRRDRRVQNPVAVHRPVCPEVSTRTRGRRDRCVFFDLR